MGARLDHVVGLLRGPHKRKPGGGVMARCPAHDDRTASLSIDEGDDRRLLFKCFSGCTADDIRKALRLEWADVMPPKDRDTSRHSAKASDKKQTPSTGGISVDALAVAKGLPVSLLHSLGVADTSGGLLIPYKQIDGSPARARVRKGLRATADGCRWDGSASLPIVPYGLDRLSRSRENGPFLIIVEGESDCWTCWHHGLPALGIPGATMYNKLEAGHVEGFSTLCLL